MLSVNEDEIHLALAISGGNNGREAEEIVRQFGKEQVIRCLTPNLFPIEPRSLLPDFLDLVQCEDRQVYVQSASIADCVLNEPNQ